MKKSVWKKRLIWTAILLTIVGSIVGYMIYNNSKNKMTWRTVPSQNRTVTVSITATGTINPVTQVNVGSEVSGRIQRMYKDFNDHVKRGELLAVLDTSTLEMALADARIELRKAQLTANENRIDLETATELFSQNMIAQFELQRAQYTHELSLQNIEKARFAVQRAQTNLNNAKIYSPIDGVIIHRAVDEGQTVAASLNVPTLFIIANNLDEMQIEAQIDEADIGKVKEDMRARFSIDAFPDVSFTGRVRQVRLNPIVEQNVVSYKVIISLTNPEGIIMPGMTANVEIIIDQKRDVLAISERALQFRPTKELWDTFKLPWDDSYAQTGRVRQRPGGSAGERPADGSGGGRPGGGRPQQPALPTNEPQTVQIWVLDESGIPKPKPVQVGISDGNFIEIVSGLSEGEQIIIGVNQANMLSSQAGAFGGSQMGGVRVMRM
jgi:HlyD family secretion protein